ncbi:hypothetical protein BV898_14661 [Hypsibius exemplaris]|uniref:Uncharacterized protein n=1 Tax=Hypsibius exemplaris TaxID=2072580 RepID=A0A9X6RJR8_HYPEX|nr:hypothetical protein BV898_14661 [Hypsibius exemplaris]
MHHIDAVGIVVQGLIVRLPPAKLYVYNKVLSFFRKDVRDNLFWLITFAQGKDVPAGNTAPGGDEFDRMRLERKWDVGVKSMSDFFEKFRNAQPASLLLSRAVIHQRLNLELVIKGLLRDINDDLKKVEQKKDLTRKVSEKRQVIEANKNYEVDVTETETVQEDLKAGYALVCSGCESNCHNPCITYFNNLTWMCEAMDAAYCCTVCPRKCNYLDHHISGTIFVKRETKKRQMVSDIMEKYNIAVGEATAVSQLIVEVKNETDRLRQQLLLNINAAHKCLQKLEETALKPNPMSALGYIDLLIMEQKQSATEGWQTRVEHLYQAKAEAETLMKCAKKGFDPIKDAEPSNWADALQKHRVVASASKKWTSFKSSVSSRIPSLPKLPKWMRAKENGDAAERVSPVDSDDN